MSLGSCILPPWIQCSPNPKVGIVGEWEKVGRDRERQERSPSYVLALAGRVVERSPNV